MIVGCENRVKRQAVLLVSQDFRFRVPLHVLQEDFVVPTLPNEYNGFSNPAIIRNFTSS
ncbi:MAG: hypothetical protein HXS41_02185 [Theionarchaea archaeon]|nr:hypothetical protein [Theionarchaea archaeon]MBU7019840.1 hypothetical protein [Theionarchaea archaeon]